MFVKWLVNFSLLMFVSATHGEIEVRLKNGGLVRGKAMTSEGGRTFFGFRGIPYAEKPTRFKAPVPKSSWGSNVFDATADGPMCMQIFDNIIFGQEDCLTINVYTPTLSKGQGDYKAVMVFIHGGAFQWYSGISAVCPPERIMDSDVVVVTLNYRLNSLGFLSTQDSNAPGNYGLLDQTLALKWVKDNIEGFFGDPNNVTIFGQSAGGASVSYHVISPVSKGLFQRAISMSGSAICSWAFESHPLRWAQALATQISCPTNSTEAMVECFRGKPASDLLQPIPDAVIIPFPPTMDGYFLRGAPMDVMKDSKNFNNVTYISGVVEEEGLNYVWGIISDIWDTSADPEELVDVVLENMTQGYPLLVNMVKEQYLAKVDLTNKYEVARALVQAYSDGGFIMPHYKEVQLLTEAGFTVYVYQYDYQPTYISGKVGERTSISNATSHGEELYMLSDAYWFSGLQKLPFSQADHAMSKTVLDIWSTFAKTGNPNPSLQYGAKWNPSSPKLFQIQHLNQPITVESKNIADDELYRFWITDVVAVLKNSYNSSIG